MPVPTPRLLALAVCGSPLLVLAGSYNAALVLAFIWLVALALLAGIDAGCAPGRDDLSWQREHDTKLSLGAWNGVTVTVHNATHRPVRFRVRDDVPHLLLADREASNGSCGPDSDWTFRYQVFPIHRGDYTFGPLSVRYLGPLGLAWRPIATRGGENVKVYPNLLAVRTYDALTRVGRLDQVGLVRARRWGEGTEFERLRDYSPDDEYRRINWKATARRRTPIVVDYQPERSQNVIMALDTGRLMSMRVPFGDSADEEVNGASAHTSLLTAPTALTRLDYALNSALLLAYVSQREGDRIGLIAFSDMVNRFISPRGGKAQFMAITDALYDLEPEATEPNFLSGLTYLASRVHRRSLIVLFTDFADLEGADALVHGMAHLARRHLTLVVTVRDPTTQALAVQPIIDSRSVYERAVAAGLLDARDSVRQRLRHAGVLTTDATGASISPAVINRYLEIKARGKL